MLLLIFIFTNYCYGQDVAIDEKYQTEVAEYVKKHHNAVEPHKEIKALVQGALDKSGMRDKVLIYQMNDNDDGFSGKLLNNPYRYLLVGVKDTTLDAIESTAYHEAGHIALNHHSVEQMLAKKQLDRISKFTSITISLGIFLKNLTLKDSFWQNTLGITSSMVKGLLAGGIAFTPFFVHSQYKEKQKELEADSFMYQQFIQQKRIGSALNEIADNLYRYEEMGDNLPWFATGYPTAKDRALQGLRMLQKNDYNIPELMKNMPEDTDPGVVEHLPAAIKRHLPGYFK